jgi:preprotein translocase subunit YajC
MKKPLDISEESKVQMPMKTVVSLIVIVALGCMGYFQIVENLNQHQTRLQLMESDLEKNTEFRIKWPRGLMGSLPADSEQFMLIENLYKDIEKIKKQLEDGMHNKVNIQFLQKQMDKVLVDIEKLKDANREMKYTNGKH